MQTQVRNPEDVLVHSQQLMVPLTHKTAITATGQMVTTRLLGAMYDDPKTRAEFLGYR